MNDTSQNVTLLRVDYEALLKVQDALEDGYNLVASIYSHVSHGGPTRADAEKWLETAKNALETARG